MEFSLYSNEMSTNGLSAVRCRYQVAHFVEEMFRDDFRSSDSIYDNEFASYSSETDNRDVETAEQVPGQCEGCRGEFLRELGMQHVNGYAAKRVTLPSSKRQHIYKRPLVDGDHR